MLGTTNQDETLGFFTLKDMTLYSSCAAAPAC
jgi:hypothetical protein